MKHAILSIISLLFLATNLFAAAWTGATSEPENMKKIDGKPFYVITNADELAWFAAKVNAGETTINAVLANDIVFGADTSSPSNVVWTTVNTFDGILDGNGFTIYGVYLDCNYFINTTTETAYIKNLSTKKFKTNSKRETTSSYSSPDLSYGSTTYVGVGFISNNQGTIYNVKNFNNYNANYSGGITDKNYGKIINSINYGNVTTEYYYSWTCTSSPRRCDYKYYTGFSGGIAGTNAGTIESCTNTGNVFSACESPSQCVAGVGGLVGKNETKGRIINSTNEVNISFVNQNEGNISYSIQNGNATLIDQNNGIVKSSINKIKSYYFLDNTQVNSTTEKMQTDQFAWILNTSNGTEENSGVWTHGTEGYPTWANEDSLAIRKVVFDDDGITSNRYTNYKGLVTFPEDPEPAEGYIFTGWYNADGVKVKPTTVFTADQTVNAVYMDASDVYWTINFYNAAPADTILETKSYQHGSIVTYGGVEPTLSATAKYTYTFKGWDVEPTNAVEDFNYHALYDSTIRSYKISFNDYDGELIESATFEYSKIPSCSKIPTREATVEWKYTHKGWKPALDYVTEEATYTAIYDSAKVEYKVTFMNGTEVIDEQMVPYGDAAVAPTNVTRDGYKFVGWNTSFAKVTTALTVKALFEELIIRTINVVNNDGEKIDTAKVEDGETYTLPEAPKKDGYTFDAYYDGNKKLGVAGDEISITANITITAKYIKNPESSSSEAKSSSSEKSSSSVAASSSSVAKSSSSSIKTESSSSTAKSSSSSKQPKSSSSSKKTEAIIVTAIPQFSVHVVARSLQISGAKVGSSYVLFDMQGRVLRKGFTPAANFDILVPRPGNYLLRINNSTKFVNVK